MPGHENRTRQELSAALRALLRQKPLDQLRVRELTEMYGLRRQSFYYHFTDIYDLFAWCLSRERALLLDRLEELNQELGATILMVTHDAFTASCCQRVVFLRDGQLYLELRRGGDSRKAFFQKIIQAVTGMGGGMADVL